MMDKELKTLIGMGVIIGVETLGGAILLKEYIKTKVHHNNFVNDCLKAIENRYYEEQKEES